MLPPLPPPASQTRSAPRRDVIATQRHVAEALYLELDPIVRSYVGRRLVNHADIDDVCSEVWLVLTSQLSLLNEWEPEARRRWVRGVARIQVFGAYRRDSRRADLARQLRLAVRASAQIDEHPDVLWEAFESLSAKEQEVLGALAFDGMGGSELATALGVSRSAARKRSERARIAFRLAVRQRLS